MFSREVFEDSYTLDNYIHFVKAHQRQHQEKQQAEEIQKTQYFGKRQRKNSTQLSLFSWLVKNKKPQHSLLVSLDKQLILKIYSYLRLSQTVRMSQACDYFYSCYKSLWIDKNFFEKFQTDKFTSEQLNKVIEKSKLDHIKQLKQIYQGKNIKKNREKIKMKITNNGSSHGAMLQIFSICPKLKNGMVFLMDNHFQKIIQSSFRGLRCIELNRCAYIKQIHKISKCIQLQKLVLTFNEHVTTETLEPIFKRCQKIQYLQLSECKNLDQNVFKYLKNLPELKSLTMKHFKQSFGNLNLLSYCENLEYLNIDDSLINDEQFLQNVRELKGLKKLSIRGCALLTEISIQFLEGYIQKKQCRLQEVIIDRIPNITPAAIEKISIKLQKIIVSQERK